MTTGLSFYFKFLVHFIYASLQDTSFRSGMEIVSLIIKHKLTQKTMSYTQSVMIGYILRDPSLGPKFQQRGQLS